MAGFQDVPQDQELIPLVPAGAGDAGRERILETLAEAWCRPLHADACPVGVTLDRVALVDADRGEPIDLAELLARVERRAAAGPPLPAGLVRMVTLRGCRIDRCRCRGLALGPRLLAVGCTWGDGADLGETTLADDVTFAKCVFGTGATFAGARFGARASFQGSVLGEGVVFDGASFGRAAVFSGAKLPRGVSFAGAAFGIASMFHHVEVGDDASFDGAVFEGGANFMGARFGARASFREARFGDGASFGGARFDEGATFEGSRFGDGTIMAHANFGPGCSFRDAAFDMPPMDMGVEFADGRPFPGMTMTWGGIGRGLGRLAVHALASVAKLGAGLVGAGRRGRLPARIGERVTWVARTIGDERVFRERAEYVAGELGPGAVPALGRGLRRAEFDPPEEARDDFPQLGDWAWARLLAIVQILYFLKEPALPVLRREAFGEYDWPQGPAASVLCQLALDGVEFERISKEIAEGIPTWAYETQGRVTEAVTALAAESPVVMEALDVLIRDWAADDPIDVLAILEALALTAPAAARRYEPILRGVLDDCGRGVRNPALDGHLVSMEGGEIVGYSGQSPEDYHAVRAALVLHRLFPDDRDVTAELRGWAEHHPDETIRRLVRERS